MNKAKPKKIKVGYVLSYQGGTYTRTESLLGMLSKDDRVETYIASNSLNNSLRYLQTIWGLITIRLRKNPDVYILGFRGYEVYFIVRLITAGKPLIFDEFINANMWLVEEHKKIKKDSFLGKLVKLILKYQLILSQAVLTDTQDHADYSAETYGLEINKFVPLYVGANEKIFKAKIKPIKDKPKYRILFYGNMLPLHGVDVIIEAFSKLKDLPIELVIIGSSKNDITQKKLEKQISELNDTDIIYKKWVPYNELANYIDQADICLGGPFGDTLQSRLVITGKTFQFLAMSKLVVVADSSPHSKLFKDKINCIKVEQGSASSLCSAIKWAVANTQRLPSIQAAGYKLFSDNFSSDAQYRKLVKVISDATVGP